MLKRMLPGIFCLLIVGCNKPDDGLNDQQRVKAQRLNEIARKSNGDWEKVSAADRIYIKSIAGSEHSARMVLLTMAGSHTTGPSK